MEYIFLAGAIVAYLWHRHRIEMLENEIADLKRAIASDMDVVDLHEVFDMEEAWWAEQTPGLWREDPDAYRRWKQRLN